MTILIEINVNNFYIIIAEYLKKNVPIPSRIQFDEFAAKFEGKIKAFVAEDLREAGVDPSQVNFKIIFCRKLILKISNAG